MSSYGFAFCVIPQLDWGISTSEFQSSCHCEALKKPKQSLRNSRILLAFRLDKFSLQIHPKPLGALKTLLNSRIFLLYLRFWGQGIFLVLGILEFPRGEVGLEFPTMSSYGFAFCVIPQLDWGISTSEFQSSCHCEALKKPKQSLRNSRFCPRNSRFLFAFRLDKSSSQISQGRRPKPLGCHPKTPLKSRILLLYLRFWGQGVFLVLGILEFPRGEVGLEFPTMSSYGFAFCVILQLDWRSLYQRILELLSLRGFKKAKAIFKEFQILPQEFQFYAQEFQILGILVCSNSSLGNFRLRNSSLWEF